MAKRIGELLIDAQVITKEQLDQALLAPREGGKKLGHLLVELSYVTETQLTQALSRQLSVPWVSLYHISFSRSLLNYVPREMAEKYALVPIFVRKTRKEGETLYVAMDDPTNEAAIADVATAAHIPVKPMIACPSDIRSAIRVYYQGITEPAPSTVPASELLAAAAAGKTPAARPPPPSLPRLQKADPHLVDELVPSERVTMPSDPGTAFAGQATPTSIPADALEDAEPTPAPPAEGYDEGDGPPTPQLSADAALLHASEESEPEIPESPPEPAEPIPPVREPLANADFPDAEPEIEAVEMAPRPRRARVARMLNLTLLDGTTIKVPAGKGKSPSRPDVPAPPSEGDGETLTTRDLISALRAVSHGVDASEIFGERPPQWETMVATLLALLLKKGIIADWEFVEEFRKA